MPRGRDCGGEPALSGITAVVRPASVADLAATVPLWDELRAESGLDQLFPELPDVLAALGDRLVASTRDVAAGLPASCRLAVAYDRAGVPVGICLQRVVDGGPLALTSSVLVEVLHVAKAHRRSGVGRQLLGDAVCFATDCGVDDLVAQAPGGARDLNRFLARWGFAQGTLRRGTAVGALRRRLGPQAPAGAADGSADLTHVQRLLRRRAVLGARLARPTPRSVPR